MNPVTRGLLARLQAPELVEFAEAWDAFETLIIEIYRQKAVSFAQQEHFFALQERLRPGYANLADELGRFWPQVRIKNESLTVNPFEALLALQSAKEVVENWMAMRLLPAAREAFNQLLVERIEQG